MTDRLQLYDVLGALIPGVLVMGAVFLAFPGACESLQVPKLPDAFSVIALTVAALFLGHVLQALASLAEPVVYWTWGGRPSERALTGRLGSRYLPADTGARIRQKLQAAVGPEASDRSLFLYAMTLAESAPASRASAFNGSYAYHRALLFAATALLVIPAVSTHCGTLKDMPWKHAAPILIAAVALLLLLWHRAKQRAFYYVREVLLTAERVLESRTAPGPAPTPTSP
jgi:hypothetical protein